MLIADNLLKSLNDNYNGTDDYTRKNEDYDLGEVLSYFSDNTVKHKLRFSNGTEGYFYFND